MAEEAPLLLSGKAGPKLNGAVARLICVAAAAASSIDLRLKPVVCRLHLIAALDRLRHEPSRPIN